MIVLLEVGFDFVLGVEDFAFEGIVTEQAFQPVVGEGRFTDREAARKSGVGEKSYTIKHRSGFIGKFIGYGIDFGYY